MFAIGFNWNSQQTSARIWGILLESRGRFIGNFLSRLPLHSTGGWHWKWSSRPKNKWQGNSNPSVLANGILTFSLEFRESWWPYSSRVGRWSRNSVDLSYVFNESNSLLEKSDASYFQRIWYGIALQRNLKSIKQKASFLKQVNEKCQRLMNHVIRPYDKAYERYRHICTTELSCQNVSFCPTVIIWFIHYYSFNYCIEFFIKWLIDELSHYLCSFLEILFNPLRVLLEFVCFISAFLLGLFENRFDFQFKYNQNSIFFFKKFLFQSLNNTSYDSLYFNNLEKS